MTRSGEINGHVSLQGNDDMDTDVRQINNQIFTYPKFENDAIKYSVNCNMRFRFQGKLFKNHQAVTIFVGKKYSSHILQVNEFLVRG